MEQTPNTMTEANALPDPNTLTSPERIERIQNLRRRVAEGEDVSEEEMRYAISLIRTERATASTTKPKTAAQEKATLKLADLL